VCVWVWVDVFVGMCVGMYVRVCMCVDGFCHTSVQPQPIQDMETSEYGYLILGCPSLSRLPFWHKHSHSLQLAIYCFPFSFNVLC